MLVVDRVVAAACLVRLVAVVDYDRVVIVAGMLRMLGGRRGSLRFVVESVWRLLGGLDGVDGLDDTYVGLRDGRVVDGISARLTAMTLAVVVILDAPRLALTMVVWLLCGG
jgi:hypothetical protein